jgi:nitronate monooxygenase
LTELFGVELPIIVAPMANFAGVELAVAVAEAGGLGSLPCAALNADQIRAGAAEFMSRSARPLNLNFFCNEVLVEDGATDAAWLSRISPYYVELGVDVPALCAGLERHVNAGQCLGHRKAGDVGFLGGTTVELLGLLRAEGIAEGG